MVGQTPNKSSESDEDVQCGVCTDYVASDERAVVCDECNRWFHQVCGKVSNATFNKIDKAPTDDPYYWCCDGCRRDKKKKGTKTGEHRLTRESRALQQVTTVDVNPDTQCTNKSSLDTGHVGLTDEQDEQLTALRVKNKRYQNIVDLLTKDRSKLMEQLEHSKREIAFLNNALMEKTQIISDFVENFDNQCSRANNQGPRLGVDGTVAVSDDLESGEQRGESCRRNDGNTETGETTEATDIKTLILGDSILRGMQQKVTNTEIKIRYMPGARIQNLSGYISTLKTLPSTVVLHIGTNNLHNAKTPNHVMRPLWLTIERAQKNYKNTIWIVNGILYRRDVPRNFVMDVNEALRFMCEQLKVVYRDPNEAVTARGYGRDGIHLNSLGDQQLTNFILSDLGLQACRETQEKTTLQENKDQTNHEECTEVIEREPPVEL